MSKRPGPKPGDRIAKAVRAKRLHDAGLERREIAERMGISRTYVYDLLHDPEGTQAKKRKDGYRKPCPRCGTLMSGQDGPNNPPKRCRTCAEKDQRASKHWTREAIIEAIQTFARENGRPPLATEWLVSKEERGGERYPPASAVYSYYSKKKGRRSNNPFESWADAIEAAGFPRPAQGHKVRPYGQGAHHVEKEFIVLRKEEDGRWFEYEEPVLAHSPELALSKAAFTPGEYVAIRTTSFVIRRWEPKHDYTLLPTTPGGD